MSHDCDFYVLNACLVIHSIQHNTLVWQRTKSAAWKGALFVHRTNKPDFQDLSDMNSIIIYTEKFKLFKFLKKYFPSGFRLALNLNCFRLQGFFYGLTDMIFFCLFFKSYTVVIFISGCESVLSWPFIRQWFSTEKWWAGLPHRKKWNWWSCIKRDANDTWNKVAFTQNWILHV